MARRKIRQQGPPLALMTFEPSSSSLWLILSDFSPKFHDFGLLVYHTCHKPPKSLGRTLTLPRTTVFRLPLRKHTPTRTTHTLTTHTLTQDEDTGHWKKLHIHFIFCGINGFVLAKRNTSVHFKVLIYGRQTSKLATSLARGTGQWGEGTEDWGLKKIEAKEKLAITERR